MLRSISYGYEKLESLTETRPFTQNLTIWIFRFRMIFFIRIKIIQISFFSTLTLSKYK